MKKMSYEFFDIIGIQKKLLSGNYHLSSLRKHGNFHNYTTNSLDVIIICFCYLVLLRRHNNTHFANIAILSGNLFFYLVLLLLYASVIIIPLT